LTARAVFWGQDHRLRAGWAVLAYWVTLAAGVVALGVGARVFEVSVGVGERGAMTIGAWSAAVAGLAATGLALRWDRRGLEYPGFGSDAVRGATLGFAEGALLAAVAAAVSWGGGTRWAAAGVPTAAASIGALWLLGFFLGAALFEELAFRGYPLRRALDAWPAGASLAGFGAIFAAMHLGNPGVGIFGLGNIALAGVWLGLAFWRTKSLPVVVGLHLGWNWAAAVAFGFGVSGIAFDGGLVRVVEGGSPLITGGAFGPEGGAAGTAALALGLGRWLAWPSAGRSK